MRRPPDDLVAAGGLMLLVAIVWIAIRAGWMIGLDAALLLEAAQHIPFGLAASVTRLGDTLVRFVLAAAIAAGLLLAARPRSALFLAVAVAGGAAFNELVKQAAGRARPDLLPSIEQVHGTSFPSGHAAGSAVLFGALVLLVPQQHRVPVILVAAAVAFLVGMSRVVLGVHWPSDVVAGWAAGTAWLIAVHHAFPPQPR